MSLFRTVYLILFLILFPFLLASNAQDEPLGLMLENYDYPYPVSYYDFTVEDTPVRMAYMDVSPSGTPNGKTVMLLHGKNFFGAYWRNTIKFLSDNGFRVIVPDQLGFGKSSKPDIHYSFHRMAYDTRNLLTHAGVTGVAVVGHSMGGMVASRFTLMYPEIVTHFVLENPIGLEDYKVKVPYATIEDQYKKQLQETEQSIRNYHKTYYVQWKEEYDEWVKVQYRWTLNPEYQKLAWVSAVTSDMIYTQPVVYEFPDIKAPSLVIIGQADRTAIGKDRAPDDVKPALGQYPELGKKTASAIPGARLVELDNVGHIPHFESPGEFHRELLNFIK
jgi:pimeloyl-ACP methyl ester carboxylesterase